MFNLGSLIFKASVDDKELQVGLAGASKSLDNFAKKANDTGRTMTRKLTLPILGLAAAAIKVASDFEVSSRKFSKAFDGAADDAAAAVARLNEEFGIAASTATAALAFTGDLLKGFGASSEAALELSNSTAELSAALSAYSGKDFAEVNNAITKSLLGERESLKLLGVSISEMAVQQELARRGQENLTGQALLLAKAEATLKLAYDQSADAISSFSENQNTLAFQSQKLLGEVKDLGVEFGTILIPILKDVVEKIGDVVEWFGELDEGQKKTILTVLGLTAAAGPAIQAIAAMSKALSFLVANPIVAAIAGVAALTIGFIKLVEAQKQAQFDESYEKAATELQTMYEATGDATLAITEYAIQSGLSFDHVLDIALALGIATDETKAQVELEKQRQGYMVDEVRTMDEMFQLQTMVGDAIQRGQFTGLSGIVDLERERVLTLEAAQEQVLALSDNLDLQYEQVLRMGLANQEVTGLYRESLETLLLQYQTSQDVARVELERLTVGQRMAAAREAEAEAEAARLVITQGRTEAEQAAYEASMAQTKSVSDARLEALDEYNKALRESEVLRNLQLIDETESLEDQISAARSYADALIEIGYTGELVEQSWVNADGTITTAVSQGNIALNQLTAVIAGIESSIKLLDEAAAKEEKRIADKKIAEQKLIDKTAERVQAQRDATEARIAFEAEATANLQQQTLSRIELIEIERDARIKEAQDLGAATVDLEAYYKNLIIEEQDKLTAERLAALKVISDAKLEEYEARIAADQAAFELASRLIDEEIAEKTAAKDKKVAIEQQLYNDIAELRGYDTLLLAQKYIEEVEAAEAVGASVLLINEKYAILEKNLADEIAEKEKQARIDQFNTITGYAQTFVADISSLFTDAYNIRLDEIETQLDAELAAIQAVYDAEIQSNNDLLASRLATEEEWYLAELELQGLAEQSKADRLADELQAAIDAGNDELADKKRIEIAKLALDEEYAARTAAIEAESAAEALRIEKEAADATKAIEADLAQQKYDILLKQFKASQAASIAETIMNTASAVVRAFSDLGPIGGAIAAAIISGIGVAQIAIIASQPPPPRPALAEGGLIQAAAGGVPVTVGEGRDDELVLPLNDSVFERFADGLLRASTSNPNASNDGGNNLTVVIEGFGQIQLDLTQQALNNRKIRVPASSIVRT